MSTSSSIVFPLRCIGAGALVLLAACGSDATVAPGPSLDIGESLVRSGPQEATLTGGSGGADYIVAIANTAGPGGAKETFTLQGTGLGAPSASLEMLGAPSLALVPVEGGAASGPDVGRDFEARIRARERRDLTPRIGAARTWYDQRAALSTSASGAQRSTSFEPARRDGALPADLQVGDLVTLNVNGNDACTNPVYHGTRVVAIGTHSVILADTLNPTGGFTSADYARYAARFDTLVYPLDSANFGPPTDIDANGRVGLIFTRAVNELTPRNATSYVGGFTFSRDLFPTASTARAQGCAASNQGEYFYLLAPDPTGVVNGNVRTAGFVDSTTIATIAHEFQHLINAGRRLYINDADDFEETWLDEGLAHIAEELLFYREAGLGPRSNLDTPAIRASTRIRTAFNLDMLGNAGRYRNYLTAPSTSSPYAGNDSLSTRGAAWSLLRYLADRSTIGDNTFFFRLVNSATTGYANLSSVYGPGLAAAVRDWSVSHAVDDVAVAAPALQQPSWNWHSLYATLNGSYPLKIQAMTDGTTNQGSVVAGGTTFYRLTVPADGTANLTLGDQSTTATNLQLVVVRTR
jgi:hypothetical protein